MQPCKFYEENSFAHYYHQLKQLLGIDKLTEAQAKYAMNCYISGTSVMACYESWIKEENIR